MILHKLKAIVEAFRQLRELCVMLRTDHYFIVFLKIDGSRDAMEEESCSLLKKRKILMFE